MIISPVKHWINQFADTLTADTRDVLIALLQEAEHYHAEDKAAHMTAVCSEPALMGQLIATQHQGNLLSAELYPHLQKIEAKLLAQFASLFDQSVAQFTQGGSQSTLTALWMATKQSKGQSKLVYSSDQCHYSVAKACQILGLELTLIPTNAAQQINVDALAVACAQQTPLAIVANFGSTRSGQLDDLQSLLSIAPTDSWLHVDAAWGGFLKLLPEMAADYDFSGADSISFDPHKSLNLPRASGLLMTQQSASLATFDTDYLQQPPLERVTGSYGGELFLPLWLSLQPEYLTTLQHTLRSRLKQAEMFFDLLAQQDPHGWQQCSPTGIVCFRLGNHAELTELCAAGVFSQTTLQQKTTYRAVFANEAITAQALFKRLAPFL